ncbi:MAG: putative DNA binding domain-containing protein [Armatimonadetes bacterium]|nr:putative DNA binding domain-containing protein [Armatimonadota bacterium]
MSHTFGLDPVQTEVRDLLSALDGGAQVRESQRVDLKEEHGRRDKSGRVGPSMPHNEQAAKELASAAACMANTPGGGALLCGVTDGGVVLGTELDGEWLRHRIYELTERRLTVDISEAFVTEHRLLVIRAPQAIEPIRYGGRITWRVGTNCVDVDPTAWHARRMASLNYDWSAQESTVPSNAVRPAALEQARTFLRDSNESHALDLASVSDHELLRRLNVVTGEGMLTNAGVLAFIGRSDPCLDYTRRQVPGEDSSIRVRRSGRSLLEELNEVFQALDGNNAVLHLQRGELVVGQLREIPLLAAREAIVNGVAHREWGIAEPTTIEHVGRTLRVTSPGGFVGGVNERNILSHPSKSRNRALTDLLAALRVAEREGLGVDRMTREMILVGHQPPDIREISGPYVRAALIGDNLDVAWMAWLVEMLPEGRRRDLHALLILRALVTRGWVDVGSVAEIIQLTIEEARGAIAVLADPVPNGAALLDSVAGVPTEAEDAWHLSAGARSSLVKLDIARGLTRSWPDRRAIAADYARHRGRISSTELASLVGASSSNVGGILKGLEADGLLAPSRATRRGMGFYYRYVQG